MHFSLLICSEYHEFLLYALCVLAHKVGSLKMHGESLIVAVVSVRVVLSARVASLVVFFHVLNKIRHVKKVHFAEIASRVEKDDFSIPVDLAFVKMALELIEVVKRQLFDKHVSPLDTHIAKDLGDSWFFLTRRIFCALV